MNISTVIGLSICALAITAQPIAAQVLCARTFDNKCADQRVVNTAQNLAIQNSQQKISQTARPVAPTQDYSFTRPTDITRFENSQFGTGLTHLP